MTKPAPQKERRLASRRSRPTSRKEGDYLAGAQLLLGNYIIHIYTPCVLAISLILGSSLSQTIRISTGLEGL